MSLQPLRSCASRRVVRSGRRPRRRERGLLAGAWLVALAWLVPGVLSAAEPDQSASAKRLAADYAAHLRATKGIIDIRTIHQSPLGSKAMDLVIVSAGFTAAEQEKFLKHAQDLKETFFSHAPWSRYRDWVNFHTVSVDDAGPAETRLKVNGYEGQVLTCDNGTASTYAMFAADADATLVLHNSNFSTPACGMWGVTVYNLRDTRNSGSSVHELGHALAGLGDEYIQHSGPFTGTPESMQDTVNVTTEPDPRLSKWHYWTVETWPGIFGPMTYRGHSPVANFEGAGWPKGMYRPEESCIMRGNRDGFCAVCDETMQANIFRYAELLDQVAPAASDQLLWQGESLDIRVTTIAPLRTPDASLRSRLDLYMDGRRLATSDHGEVGFRLDAAKVRPGIVQLGALLNIQSEAIRRDFGFLSTSRAWRVEVLPHIRPTLGVQAQVEVAAQGSVDVPVTIRHPDPSLFTLRMEHAPDGAVLKDGRFRWQVGDHGGSWRVDFIAALAGRDVVSRSLVIRVRRSAQGGNGPVIRAPAPVAAVVGKPFSLKPAVEAAGDDHLLFSAIGLPAGAALDRHTGELTWTPASAQAGPHAIDVQVMDGRGSATGRVVVHVSRPGRPTPVSYSNSYLPDTLASLGRWHEGPFLYQRIFETLRLLRDRYGRIHQPALAAAEEMYAELTPPFQTNVLEDLALNAWAFTDKPAVLAWMRRIADAGDTPEHRRLLAQVELIGTVEEIQKIEIGGGRERLVPTAKALSDATDPLIQAALARALKAICQRAGDDAGCRRDLLAVLSQTTSGPGRAALVGLVPIEVAAETTRAFEDLAKDPDRQVAAAAQQTLDYFHGLARTSDFITTWKVSGPYLAKDGISLFDEPFAPENGDAPMEWQPVTLQAGANGVYALDLNPLFGGNQRAAYLTTTLHSAKAQEVLFATGSDDAIKVWLNGELIHAKNVQRGVKPGDDRFRGRLKQGDNVVLCKIVQYSLGWGACMSLRAGDGGPALGITLGTK